MTFVLLDPREQRQVRVRVAGDDWVDGRLEAIRRADGEWSWFVRCSGATTAAHGEWFAEGQVKGAADRERTRPARLRR